MAIPAGRSRAAGTRTSNRCWNSGRRAVDCHLERWPIPLAAAQRCGGAFRARPATLGRPGLARARAPSRAECDGRLWSAASAAWPTWSRPATACAVDPRCRARGRRWPVRGVPCWSTHRAGWRQTRRRARCVWRRRHACSTASATVATRPSLGARRVRAPYEDHEGTWSAASAAGCRARPPRPVCRPSLAVPEPRLRRRQCRSRRDFVWSVLEDRRHNLWVGSEAGLDVLDAARALAARAAGRRHGPERYGPAGRSRRAPLAGWLDRPGGLDGDTCAAWRSTAIRPGRCRLHRAWRELRPAPGARLVPEQRTDGALLPDGVGAGPLPGNACWRSSTAHGVRPRPQFDGTILSGRCARGLCHYRAHGGSSRASPGAARTKPTVCRGTVYSPAAGTDGGLWLGHGGGSGARRLDDGSVRVHVHDADDNRSATSSAPGAVASGRDGHLYFGAAGGFPWPPSTRAVCTRRRRRVPVHIAAFSLDQFELAPGTPPPTTSMRPFLRPPAAPHARRPRLRFSPYRARVRPPARLLICTSPGRAGCGLDPVRQPAPGRYTGIARATTAWRRVRGPGRTWSEAQTLLELQVQPLLWATAPFRLRLGAAAPRADPGWPIAGAPGARWRGDRWLSRRRWRTQALEAQKAALADTAQALRDANLRL